MKTAAFVSDGLSLKETIPELRSLDAKIFATPKAVEILQQEDIRCQPLSDPMGIWIIFGFGHKEIHLFGFDLCNAEGDGTRIAFEDRVFYTSPEQGKQAEWMVNACVQLSEKGADIAVHGDGMLAHMVRSVLRGFEERTLTAVYDMQVSPPTYEVFSFLAEAERYRAQNGFTNIDVIFAPGPIKGFRDDGLPPTPSERASMLHRICVSGARLLPSVRNVHVMAKRSHIQGDVFPPDWTNDRPRFCYGPRFQKDAHQCLEATKAARDEISLRFRKPYTTITLREAEYWPKRNSNRAAWERCARWLQNKGTPAVVVPDTHGSGLSACEEFSPSAWDVDLRLALYEGAVLNLGVMNGPMVLPMFSAKQPMYLIFQKPDEDSPGTQEKFMNAQGIVKGDSYTLNGWTIWEDDTPDNVMRAVGEWFQESVVRMA